MTSPETTIIQSVKAWVDQVVIGLGLCPFAKQPASLGRIRYRVIFGEAEDTIWTAFDEELALLKQTPPEKIATTIVILADAWRDFLDYNDQLDEADHRVSSAGLEGIIQVASFHPDYQFGGTERDDPGNFTNRAPWPLLHLLREDEVSRAVAHYPDVETIPDRNIALMRRLGAEHMKALLARCQAAANAIAAEGEPPCPS